MKMKIKGILKNRGLVGFMVLALLIFTFLVGRTIVNRVQTPVTTNLVQAYIAKEIDGDYLNDIEQADDRVGKVLDWKGNVRLFWNGQKQRVAVSKSKLKVRYGTGDVSLAINETFIFEKNKDEWKMVWHNAAVD